MSVFLHDACQCALDISSIINYFRIKIFKLVKQAVSNQVKLKCFLKPEMQFTSILFVVFSFLFSNDLFQYVILANDILF